MGRLLAQLLNSGTTGRGLTKTIASIASAAVVVAAASDASAYVVKKSKSGAIVHWDASDITFTLDPSVDENVKGAADATRTSMQSWSGTAGAPDLAIVAPTADAPKTPGMDRKNGVFFKKGGYAPAGKALAITVLTYDNASGRILDADIIFNGAYTFAVLDPVSDKVPAATGTHPTNTDSVTHEVEDPTVGVTYDLHHVIAHELGHSLGMNDEMGRRDALMFRYTAPNDPSLRAPSSDDVSGLAEIYANRADAESSGCGATVAPKKPSFAASHLAMVGVLAFLVFLVLRSRSDKRARLGFVVAAAAAGLFLLPSSSKGETRNVKTDASLSLGHARATVRTTSTTIEDGLFKTAFELTTTSCRAAHCPKTAKGAAWGGTVGDLRQEVGGHYAPHAGDEVDVSFTKLPDALAPLAKPLAGRADAPAGESRVVTLAR